MTLKTEPVSSAADEFIPISSILNSSLAKRMISCKEVRFALPGIFHSGIKSSGRYFGPQQRSYVTSSPEVIDRPYRKTAGLRKNARQDSEYVSGIDLIKRERKKKKNEIKTDSESVEKRKKPNKQNPQSNGPSSENISVKTRLEPY